MSREGTVTIVDRDQSAVVIAVQGQGFTIIELTSDWDIVVGDTIRWENDDALGFETYSNVTRGTDDEVFVQNHGVDESSMRLQMGL